MPSVMLFQFRVSSPGISPQGSDYDDRGSSKGNLEVRRFIQGFSGMKQEPLQVVETALPLLMGF